MIDSGTIRGGGWRESRIRALGSLAALAKLTSRTASGGTAIGTQGTELGAPIKILDKSPNKSRALVRLDLSALGAPEMIIDQRCDGKAAFASNIAQGDRPIAGNQLQNMLNVTFPTPVPSYREAGTSNGPILGRSPPLLP